MTNAIFLPSGDHRKLWTSFLHLVKGTSSPLSDEIRYRFLCSCRSEINAILSPFGDHLGCIAEALASENGAAPPFLTELLYTLDEKNLFSPEILHSLTVKRTDSLSGESWISERVLVFIIATGVQ
jgi:hypothetical protein